MTDVLHFISEVLKDPERQASYRADPEGAMAAASLSDDGKTAIRSEDPATIGAHIGRELAAVPDDNKPY